MWLDRWFVMLSEIVISFWLTLSVVFGTMVLVERGRRHEEEDESSTDADQEHGEAVYENDRSAALFNMRSKVAQEFGVDAANAWYEEMMKKENQ